MMMAEEQEKENSTHTEAEYWDRSLAIPAGERR